MTEVTLAPQAIRNILAISEYVALANPQAAKQIRDSIRTTIDRLDDFPELGRRQRTPWVRKLIEARYGYLIFYRYRGHGNSVTVIAVKHPAMKRAFQDK
jgi:toxin ParE1/3/4